MEIEELIVGEQYVFVNCYDSGTMHVGLCIFGGIFKDNTSILKNPPQTSPRMVTVHLNGLTSKLTITQYPTLIYWDQGNVMGWDYLSTYLGEPRCINHSIVVPLKYWEDDPHFHVVDWKNPNYVVERKIGPRIKMGVEADWEQKLRAKRDVAMAKALGF